MTEQESLSIDEVRALVAERARYDDWLSALEARRDQTPPHVFSRVHGDYSARRTQVLDRLVGHVPAIGELLASLDERVAALDATMGSHEDERAEALLRHAVGEFDDGTWDEVRSRVESTLERLRGEREAVDAQREDVRGLLAQATPDVARGPEAGATDGASAGDVPRPVPGAPDAAHAAHEPSGVDTPSLDAVAVDAMFGDTAPGAPSRDHAVDADSVAGLFDGLAPHTTAHADAAPLDAAPVATEQGGHALVDASSSPSAWFADAHETGAPVASPTADHAAPVGDEPPVRAPSVTETLAAIDADVVDVMPAVDAVPTARADRPSIWGGAAGDIANASETRTGSTPSASSSPAAAPEAFDELAFLRSVIDPKPPAAGSQATGSPATTGASAKTLRCTECNTLNLPTEWYCERCGSELASF